MNRSAWKPPASPSSSDLQRDWTPFGGRTGRRRPQRNRRARKLNLRITTGRVWVSPRSRAADRGEVSRRKLRRNDEAACAPLAMLRPKAVRAASSGAGE